jgi:hypothetical protein
VVATACAGCMGGWIGRVCLRVEMETVYRRLMRDNTYNHACVQVQVRVRVF